MDVDPRGAGVMRWAAPHVSTMVADDLDVLMITRMDERRLGAGTRSQVYYFCQPVRRTPGALHARGA
jgi:hypothetical protein